jgi:hypothetical protein
MPTGTNVDDLSQPSPQQFHQQRLFRLHLANRAPPAQTEGNKENLSPRILSRMAASFAANTTDSSSPLHDVVDTDLAGMLDGLRLVGRGGGIPALRYPAGRPKGIGPRNGELRCGPLASRAPRPVPHFSIYEDEEPVGGPQHFQSWDFQRSRRLEQTRRRGGSPVSGLGRFGLARPPRSPRPTASE